MKLEEEIKQSKFKDEYHKLGVNIIYSASWMSGLNLQVLKNFNISVQQFNILRILKGRHPEPATVKLLTARMIDKMSNASRLVEKLKQKGFVERTSCPNDRRQVDIAITEEGVKIVNQSSILLEKEMEDKLSVLTKKEAKQLNDLLDKMRD
ncbi:MAG: DNA-binding MarR family transcriptional regulator [Granulosicoccus sp.]|jgi:DNA-binding MarR family transcriptional regulator